MKHIKKLNETINENTSGEYTAETLFMKVFLVYAKNGFDAITSKDVSIYPVGSNGQGFQIKSLNHNVNVWVYLNEDDPHLVGRGNYGVRIDNGDKIDGERYISIYPPKKYTEEQTAYIKKIYDIL